jgi:hypothetical protein
MKMTTIIHSDEIIITAAAVLRALSLEELREMLNRLLERPEDDGSIEAAIALVDHEIRLELSAD